MEQQSYCFGYDIISKLRLERQQRHCRATRVVTMCSVYLNILWCTKRVKSTDTGRPVFQKYGSTRKNTGRPVNLRVDPYFRYGSTRIFAGRPVFQIRVDPYFYGSTRISDTGRPVFLRVDPYIYGSTRILRVYLHLRVDP